MEFLLAAINAKYIHSNPALYSLRAYALEGPDGGALGKRGVSVEIAEYTINMQAEHILADLYRRKPDVVAFSCYIWNWRLVRELVAEFAKVLPDTPIWLGGPEVSFDAGQVLEELPMVKGVMVGEGEETFSELLNCYADGCHESPAVGGLWDIRGIVFRDGGRVYKNRERENMDINALPFLYRDLDCFKNRIIYYESGRGCPFRCSYCLSSVDRNVRLRDMETVKKELLFFLEHKVAQVKFVDRTFNCNREHARGIWEFLLEHDNGVTKFHFEIAADLLGEEELTLLSKMRPGLVQLEIGVQSTNPDTLREINRFTDMGKLRETVERIRRGRNIHIHLDLIAGLPYEDYGSFGRSFDEVYAMGPQQLQLGFLKVLKGSPMQEKAGGYGINYTSLPPYEVLYSKWLSYGELCRLKRIEEMVELYYNSGQFAHTLPVLVQAFTGPFDLFGKLADFYMEKGYFQNNPSRVYRYEVLLDFACRYDGGREELYCELLTYDCYLRENMKSRPAFARDLQEYKGRMRKFYGDGDAVRRMLPDYGAYEPKQVARMTHMDVFFYPVWEENGTSEAGKAEDAHLVLFDYGRRNPLTKEAWTGIWNDGEAGGTEDDEKDGSNPGFTG